MNTRTDNVTVFKDTMSMCEHDPSLKKAVQASIAGTVLYEPGEKIDIGEPRYEDTEVSITKERTFATVQKTVLKGRTAVLNFASAVNPGGGVTRGASAQEEALCRCSTLYPVLNTKTLFENYYKVHRRERDCRFSDRVIYSPDIMIIKDDTDHPERLDPHYRQPVDVITCAAPNLRPDWDPPVIVTGDELYNIHLSRGRQILSSAAAHQADNVILGAFGCGAFCNDPDIVSAAYDALLDEFAGYFDQVIFAVYCRDYETANYDAFARIV